MFFVPLYTTFFEKPAVFAVIASPALVGRCCTNRAIAPFEKWGRRALFARRGDLSIQKSSRVLLDPRHPQHLRDKLFKGGDRSIYATTPLVAGRSNDGLTGMGFKKLSCTKKIC